VKVLIVDDDVRTAAFILKGLRQAGFVVDHEADGQDALHRALAEPYDAAVIDIMLPSLDGLSLVRELRQRKVRLPVLILSAKGSVQDRVQGLSDGGDDYLTKPFAFSELLARLHALIRRAQGISEPARLMVGNLSIDLLSRKVFRGERFIELQPREFALLEYLMRNQGRVVSKTMIMEHVWNYNFDPETNIVEARICRLREKIDRGPDPKLIRTMRGIGYVLREDDA
jgi:two-component system OmpR family response regulator